MQVLPLFPETQLDLQLINGNGGSLATFQAHTRHSGQSLSILEIDDAITAGFMPHFKSRHQIRLFRVADFEGAQEARRACAGACILYVSKL